MLATPLIIDLVVATEFATRVQVKGPGKSDYDGVSCCWFIVLLAQGSISKTRIQTYQRIKQTTSTISQLAFGVGWFTN